MTRATALKEPEESFSIVFDLTQVSETRHFVARQRELDAMHEALHDSFDRRAVTLYGLGGIGKTQLAIAYAKAHRSEYSAIFWLNIKDEISVKQSYTRIARQILREYPQAGQFGAIMDESRLDEATAVAAVKRWLEHTKNTQWLMIFDNYDNPRMSGDADSSAVNIEEFLPEAYHGSMIITTRSARVNIGQPLRVTKMEDVRDSLRILSDASGREDAMKGQSN